MTSFRRRFLIVAVIGLLSTSAVLRAATITWFAPKNITGTSDVLTSGTLFQAVNFGTTGATTVNGVTFAPLSVGTGTTSITSGNVTLVGTGTQFAGRELRQATFTTGSSPFSTLPVAYQDLVRSFIFSQNGSTITPSATITFTLSNLTIGQQYDVQYWVNDSRGTQDTAQRQVQLTTGTSTSQLLSVNTSGTTGGLGQWVLGTFIADGSTQVFTASGVSSGTTGPSVYATAMQVRVVPEPSTFGLAACGAALCAFLIRRRRSKIDPLAT